MFDRISLFILRNRVAFILFVVMATAVMGFFASRVQLAYDNAKFIPSTDQDYIDYQEFKSIFGDDGNVVLVGISTPKINELDFFGDWYDLSHSLSSMSGVNRVLSLATIPELYKDTETYQFAQRKVFANKPETQQELDSLMTTVRGLRFFEGLLFKDSSYFTILAVSMDRNILDTYRRIGFVAELENKVESVCKKHEVEPHFSGLPYIRTEYLNKTKSEIIFFTILSMVITSLILLFFFRSFRVMFFCLLVVAVGVVWQTGILVLLGYKITAFIGILPPLMVVIGIANCIYLLNKYHDEFKTHNNQIKALQRVISKVGLAVFFTNLTTAIGFGVFVLTGSTVLEEFGLTAFLSVLSVYLISIVLIPVIFSFLPPPPEKHTKHLDSAVLNNLIAKVSNIVQNKRRVVYIVTVLFVLFSFVGIGMVRSMGYMVDDISSSDPLYKDLKFFERQVNGVMPFEILVDTREKNGVKNVNTLQKIDQLERKLSEFPEFTRPVSISQVIKFANQAYYNGNPRRYIVPNILDLGKIMGYMPYGDDSPSLLQSMVDSNYQKARISLQMADVGSEKIKVIRAEVDSIAAEIFPSDAYTVKTTGTSVIFLKGNDYLISNLAISLAVAFVIISGIMALIFISFRMIIISLIPNLIPLIFTLGVMGYTNVHLKPSTVLVFSVAFGIAVDFTIHFLSKYRMELKRNNFNIQRSVINALNEVGVSMVYTAVILFFGFIIFSFSDFGGTISLGIFTSITLIVALLSNLIVLPSLLLSYDLAKERSKSKKRPLILYPDEEV
jgi:predicted RND superfamily exporter protein